MLRWFPRLQVATACFSCSPPDLNFLDPYFVFVYMHYNHCHRATAHLQFNIYCCYMNDTIFTASCSHAWLMPTVAELLWPVSHFQWLSPAGDILWKCDWVMTCNNAARFWYHCVSGRLSYNITQVYVHTHTHTHTHTRTHTHTHTHFVNVCACH